jgi:F0F1-type ATP synthase membrane subunit b/b'
MASIRNLKKDINNVLGDVIEAVYIVEHSNRQEGSQEGTSIIDQAIETFDRLIAEVNKKEIEDRKAHLKQVRQSLEQEATALVERINKMV